MKALVRQANYVYTMLRLSVLDMADEEDVVQRFHPMLAVLRASMISLCESLLYKTREAHARRIERGRDVA